MSCDPSSGALKFGLEHPADKKAGLVNKYRLTDAPEKRERPKQKSRYIGGLQKRAAKRQIEAEIIEERVSKRERETEGYEKEAFVTSGYKKVLEQRKKFQEDLERQDEDDKRKTQKKGNFEFMSGLLNAGHASRSRVVNQSTPDQQEQTE
eukprot:GHVL01024870.1.p1 GENE.GHVL01024870.1~~GHVL01024870.1.p1  ORF type:complete len:150 (-),score=32.33 GHVL01024870.1:1207-1656(-)